MKRFPLIICALLICLVSLAGDIKHVSITYEYISDNPNESPEQAEQTALHLAKQKALEEHFCRDVVGITSTMQRNRQEGDNISSSSACGLHAIRSQSPDGVRCLVCAVCRVAGDVLRLSHLAVYGQRNDPGNQG